MLEVEKKSILCYYYNYIHLHNVSVYCYLELKHYTSFEFIVVWNNNNTF